MRVIGTDVQHVQPDLNDYRRYLKRKRKLVISAGKQIEEDFVSWTGAKVDALTRRMRLARLLAVAGDGLLNESVWQRAIWLDEQVMHRTSL